MDGELKKKIRGLAVRPPEEWLHAREALSRCETAAIDLTERILNFVLFATLVFKVRVGTRLSDQYG